MIAKIVAVIFVTFAVTTTVRAQNATICDEEELNAFIPNVRDCNAWFRCGPGGPEPGRCSEEFNFNPLTRACDWPENVECFRCPPNETITTHQMDRSCRSFIRCIGGSPTQLMCEDGLQFNNATGQCDLPSVVQCTTRFTCPERLPIDGSIIAVRDAHNCSVYYICVGERYPMMQECNRELHFDPVTGLCTFPNLTDCTTKPERPPEAPEDPIFRCPSDGTHAHPSSCTIYFVCANGFAHEFTCEDGLHFNERTGLCDHQSAANCNRENYRMNYWQT